MVQMAFHRNYPNFFSNSKLSHVENTLLQKHSVNFQILAHGVTIKIKVKVK